MLLLAAPSSSLCALPVIDDVLCHWRQLGGRIVGMSNIVKSDAEFIEEAYGNAVAALFKQMFLSMTGNIHGSDEKAYVATFNTGLNKLRRARELALGAVEATS